MDGKTLDYLMSRMRSERNSRENSKDSRRDMRDSRHGEGRGNVDFEGSMDFRDGSGSDYRYSNDSRDYKDYNDYARMDSRDYRKSPRLSKTDMHHWKQMMENEDGTRGPHYDMQQIMSVAEKIGVRFDDFDEKEFCIAVNMMYSDYCKVAKKFVAPDKELAFFAELAKAFLEDEDGPEASEKLALYFHCIVDA
jgi:hypothetical protein